MLRVPAESHRTGYLGMFCICGVVQNQRSPKKLCQLYVRGGLKMAVFTIMDQNYLLWSANHEKVQSFEDR